LSIISAYSFSSLPYTVRDVRPLLPSTHARLSYPQKPPSKTTETGLPQTSGAGPINRC